MRKLLFLLSICPLLLSAQPATFQYSNLPKAEVKMSIAGHRLRISALPEDEKPYNGLRFTIGDGEALVALRQGDSVSLSLPALGDGRHKIVVEKYFEEKTPKGKSWTWWSWIQKNLYLLVRQGECYFEDSPTLPANRKALALAANPQDFLAPSPDIHSDNSAVVALARKITAGARDDYSRALAVHDWLASNIYYDYDAYYASKFVCGSTDVLRYKKSVCNGYANLAAALLRSVGIPCRVVSGYGLGVGTSGEWDAAALIATANHAWNELYVADRWLIMDATWDSDMEYRAGRFDKKKGLRGRQYFDLTVEAFSLDHKIMAEEGK
jgi:hypothetical protein